MDSSTALPETYKAITKVKPGETPNVETLPLPKPGNNQVLVKIAFAPINPSDLLAMRGLYGPKDTNLCGLEGSGTVVALGENLKVPFTIGQKVHLLGPGTMGQYCLANTNDVWPVQGDISLEQASSHFINPLTVVCFGKFVQQGGHKTVIHTVGSSAMGRMVIRYFKAMGIKTINILRKDEYIQELKDIGADYVLNSTAPDFEKQLKEIAEKENATIAFDAIAADFTGKVVTAQPAGSICYVYSALGGHAVNTISIMELFKGKQITGFTLSMDVDGMVESGKIKREDLNKAHTLLNSTLQSHTQKIFKLEEVAEALALYEKSSSAGKILFQPNN